MGGFSAPNSGGQSFGVPKWAWFALLAVAIYIIISYSQRYFKKNSCQKLLRKISVHEPLWDETEILNHVRKSFIEIQEAWCDKNLGKLRKLLHPTLFIEWNMKINDMAAKGVRDVMKHISIGDVEIIHIKNYNDDEKDEFTVGIDAGASNETLDNNGNVISSRALLFYEFWTFERENNEWVLREINKKRKEGEFLKPNINEE
jgi:predicted lipid-binding transport protein (Tim44 family)